MGGRDTATGVVNNGPAGQYIGGPPPELLAPEVLTAMAGRADAARTGIRLLVPYRKQAAFELGQFMYTFACGRPFMPGYPSSCRQAARGVSRSGLLPDGIYTYDDAKLRPPTPARACFFGGSLEAGGVGIGAVGVGVSVSGDAGSSGGGASGAGGVGGKAVMVPGAIWRLMQGLLRCNPEQRVGVEEAAETLHRMASSAWALARMQAEDDEASARREEASAAREAREKAEEEASEARVKAEVDAAKSKTQGIMSVLRSRDGDVVDLRMMPLNELILDHLGPAVRALEEQLGLPVHPSDEAAAGDTSTMVLPAGELQGSRFH